MNIKLYVLRSFIVFALCQLVATPIWAQNAISVKGRVLDEEKLPLPGVSIKIKGTTQGTVTDVNGNYSLNAINGTDVLVFSFVGYQPVEQAVNGRTSINASLKAAPESLNEVVVVAYGTQKKISVTGALTTVKGEELAKSPSVNLTQTLVGRTSAF